MDTDTVRADTSPISSWLAESLASIVVIGLVVLLLEFRSSTSVTFDVVTLYPVPAVAVLAGLLFGPAVVLSVVIGYLVFLGAHALLAPVALLNAIGYLTLGWLSYTFGRNVGRFSSGFAPGVPSLSTLREFTFIALLSALWATAIVSWGYEIAGYAEFFPGSLVYFASTVLSVVVFGAVIFGLVWLVPGDEVPQFDARTARREPGSGGDNGNDGIPVLSILLPVVWLLTGNAVSIGYNLIERIPSSVFRESGWGALLAFKGQGMFGRGGLVIQTALGTTILVLWIALLRRDRLG